MSDRIDELLHERGQKHRRRVRKQDAVRDARRHEGRVEEAIAELIESREDARRDNDNRRVNAINARLQGRYLELSRVRDSIKRLERIIPNLKDAIRRLTVRIQDLKRERRERRDSINFTPGDPYWAGAEQILEREVEPAIRAARGVDPNSGKRHESFGNPSSDHYWANTYASARDFPLSNDYAAGVAVARALGVGYSGSADDYKLYYFVRGGHTFRVQIIASTHGTGPHLHVGIARV